MKLSFKLFQKNIRAEQEKIYDQCHRKLYFTALRILNNQFEAEEVMHDTLLKYFSTESQFDTIGERDSWMSRVCINMAIDIIRKRKVENSKLEMAEVEETVEILSTTKYYLQQSEDEQISLKGVTPQMIKEAMGTLSDGYRTVLSLYLFEGYDYEEISKILGIKEVSVRTQFIRGKANLIDKINCLKERQKINYGTY